MKLDPVYDAREKGVLPGIVRRQGRFKAVFGKGLVRLNNSDGGEGKAAVLVVGDLDDPVIGVGNGVRV
jgi:hypothetical protein